MAEAEQSDKNTSTPHRRPYYQNRPGSSYRGRGRANASVSKALHLFGVRDLREILDRKHQEEEQYYGPPPDPSYNYLKDPSRENVNDYQSHKSYKEQHSERTPGDNHSRGYNNFRGPRGRGRGGGTSREHRHYEPEKTSFIQNPVNIKVELVASTGVRNCKLDEETKIADIKHIPNHKLKDLRPTGGNVAGKDFPDRYRNDRGRGRGQRGRGRGGRGRGRGERGRGRGQGRYSNRNNESDQNNQPQQQTTEISEESWDKECVTSPTENEEEEQNQENPEEDFAEVQGEHENDDPEQYYEGDEDYLEASEQIQSLEEATGDGDVKLEENLVVVASSENEEKRKRTVKFKLEDTQSDQAANQESEKDKKDVEKNENKTPEPTK